MLLLGLSNFIFSFYMLIFLSVKLAGSKILVGLGLGSKILGVHLCIV
jgi:hypothetical protein